MKFKIMTSIILLLLSVSTAMAITLDGSCDIRFAVQSTLHDFVGEVACQPFTLTSEEPAGNGVKQSDSSEVSKASEVAKRGSDIIRQPVVRALVSEMDTDNSGRNKKMYAMFEEEQYPAIQGLFADLDPEVLLQQLQATTDVSGQLEFELRIREISQRVTAEVRDLQVSPEQISFVMGFPLLLPDFQLEPPSVLGFIRVDEHVQIEADVLLRRR